VRVISQTKSNLKSGIPGPYRLVCYEAVDRVLGPEAGRLVRVAAIECFSPSDDMPARTQGGILSRCSIYHSVSLDIPSFDAASASAF
jgi:hypothetical protein